MNFKSSSISAGQVTVTSEDFPEEQTCDEWIKLFESLKLCSEIKEDTLVSVIYNDTDYDEEGTAYISFVRKPTTGEWVEYNKRENEMFARAKEQRREDYLRLYKEFGEVKKPNNEFELAYDEQIILDGRTVRIVKKR